VAARGIDLPGLSLVIHVELPRDAETLQHRSGRTGRAGAKGMAVLVVPYPARRRVDRMLAGAGIKAEWAAPPSRAVIAVRDRERLITTIGESIGGLDDDDRQLGAALLEQHGVDEIAAALVRAHRARLPEAEELIDAGTPQRSTSGRSNADTERGPARGQRQSPEAAHVSGPGRWFRLDVGRRHRADPRWIIPLLCRRGGVTKPDIGAIRIGGSETLVEIAPDMADRFIAALARHAARGGRSAEDQIAIQPVDGSPAPRAPLRPVSPSTPPRRAPRR
jgi:ATP-dependent RNA helicase DeaD